MQLRTLPKPDSVIVLQVADPVHKLVQLRMRVQGPPQPQWVTETARDTKLLREALSVAEFATVMQPVLLGETVALPELIAALQQPASSTVLPELYSTLLRSCLLEVVHLEAPCVLPSVCVVISSSFCAQFRCARNAVWVLY